jgi:probable phosphoglycerate mutase
MNKLSKLSSLKNKYFALRHGESMANIEGIVVSTPENGIPKYGLSEEGRAQVKRSMTKANLNNEINSTTRIISSDFKRAQETAELVHQLLSNNYTVTLDARLRERDFGNFELQSNINYQTVWDNDATDPSHTFDNTESANAVMQRATELVASFENDYEGETFLLVAHGDTLQILQAAFKKYPASKQREMKHLETAEIRKLQLIT